MSTIFDFATNLHNFTPCYSAYTKQILDLNQWYSFDENTSVERPAFFRFQQLNFSFPISNFSILSVQHN